MYSPGQSFIPEDEVEISAVVYANSTKLNLLKDLNIWICFTRIMRLHKW